MAELIDPNEIMFTKFEPRVANRFIVYMEGLPSYMIKKIQFPNQESNEVRLDHINMVRKLKGKTVWGDMTMTLYEPILPSGAQIIMNWLRTQHEDLTGRDGYADFYKKDFTINILGPVGDKVGEWTVVGAYAKNVAFGEGDWSNDQPIEVTATIAMDYCILRF